MADWQLCPLCRKEYEDPLDRRYHAQPTACPVCGPIYRLLAVAEFVRIPIVAHKNLNSDEFSDIAMAAELLRDGKILAVKGIGGYHLACDARNAAAVTELRERKFRKERPFALMVADVVQAGSLVELSDEHRRLLQDIARPIVVARAKVELPGVAPGNASLGVMLPYAPLHHLLFKFGAPSPLVLTSANRSSEPIAYRDEDARDRLTGIADAFLFGERPIARRVDDSVVTVRRGRPFVIRRSRGFSPAVVCRLAGGAAPGPAQVASEEDDLPLTPGPFDVAHGRPSPARGEGRIGFRRELSEINGGPILALGSDLKNAIALVVDGEVLVSQHIGDLGDAETDAAFEETVRDLLVMYEIRMEDTTVVHDLHPQFTSTRFAQRPQARRRLGVQHHEAHIASVVAEHGSLDEPVVGVALDGTGYGTDGTIWGGELFVGSVRRGFQRAAHLRPVQMPGGDAAARFPVQAAAAFVADLPNRPDLSRLPLEMPKRFWDGMKMIDRQVRCFTSTSMGRLLDAVAAILGFMRESTFEGQAAIWLEHLATRCEPQDAYPFPDFDHRPLVSAILRDRIAGRNSAEIASAFHAAIAAGVAEHVSALAKQHGIRTVALSGGVFQNEILLDAVFDRLEQESSLKVLTNQAVPVNDGGICLGQATVAALR